MHFNVVFRAVQVRNSMPQPPAWSSRSKSHPFSVRPSRVGAGSASSPARDGRHVCNLLVARILLEMSDEGQASFGSRHMAHKTGPRGTWISSVTSNPYRA